MALLSTRMGSGAVRSSFCPHRRWASPNWRKRSLLLEDVRDRALAFSPVSRETLARLDQFIAVLLHWQERINLFAPATVPKLWTRHVADSLQLLDLAPAAKTWVDVGSGG